MVGVNVGAGQWRRARLTALTGGLMAGGLTAAVGLTAACFPALWLGLFTDNAAAFQAGALYLERAGPLYGFLGFGLAVYFASLGARQTRWPTIAVVARVAVIGAGGTLAGGQELTAAFTTIALAIVVFGAANAYGLTRVGWRGGAR